MDDLQFGADPTCSGNHTGNSEAPIRISKVRSHARAQNAPQKLALGTPTAWTTHGHTLAS